jgi:hypothetical protein
MPLSRDTTKNNRSYLLHNVQKKSEKKFYLFFNSSEKLCIKTAVSGGLSTGKYYNIVFNIFKNILQLNYCKCFQTKTRDNNDKTDSRHAE